MSQPGLVARRTAALDTETDLPQTLLGRIRDKTARVVVVGLGYVGLPVSARFAQVGFSVTGLDVDQHKVEAVNAGRCPIEGNEPGLAELVAQVVADGRLRAASSYQVCCDADIVLVAVETPIDSVRQPRYSALRAVLRDLEANLKPEGLVIIESTIAPGTMDRLVCPALEAHGRRKSGRDFFFGPLSRACDAGAAAAQPGTDEPRCGRRYSRGCAVGSGFLPACGRGRSGPD